MIPINSRTVGESEIVGGMAKLVEVEMWSPDQSGIKFVIIAADYDHELLEEWEFTDEQKAKKAFEDLSSKAIC
ncbi:hypothetical protein OAF12_06120 [Akkermansiaceae bacterium]|nr:hypothetical protein [Akkermansiaceae bacterium]